MNGKLRKYFLILLLLLVATGCANDRTKEEAKKQKAREDEQVEELYTEMMTPGFSLEAYETDYKYDEKFKSIRKLVVKDFKTLNDEQTSIEDLYSEFYDAMGGSTSFLNEAPDFTDLKAKAATIMVRIDQAKVDAKAYVDKKAIKERANASKLSSTYKKIYIELVSDDSGIKTREASMSTKLDELRAYTSTSKDALDFLTAHQTEWVNKNGTVTFYNNEVYQEYNKIVEGLK